MFESFIELARKLYPKQDTIPLHEPVFGEEERALVLSCIDSTFVSTVGRYVDEFEKRVADYTGSGYAIATVNGTSALHTALLVAGVKPDTIVITQPLTFVATCNAISYCGAEPLFVDIDHDTLGMSPDSLRSYIKNETGYKNGKLYDKRSGKQVSAILPVHIFGFPCKIDEIAQIACDYNVPLIEDAAESLGSLFEGRHTGTFGDIGIFSFNGNKIVTAGGGGILVTDNANLAEKARHLTTTAKRDRGCRHFHDEVGFNYRMPNINAALGCAQLEKLDGYIKRKRELSKIYREFFRQFDETTFFTEPERTYSNYWLNTVIFEEPQRLKSFLEKTHMSQIYTRAAWLPMYKLPMYSSCYRCSTNTTEYIYKRVANLPSSASVQLKGDL